LRSTKSRARPGSSGFSLLEVVVALAILGIAIVTLIELFSASLRSTKESSDYTTALIHARSLMDEAFAAPSPEEMSGSFEFEGGFRAERTVTEVPVAAEGEAEGGEGEVAEGKEPPYRLYEITVAVTWPPRGRTELKGRRAVYEEPL